MILDWNPSTDIYFLRVPRNEADVGELMNEYGLDLSIPNSNTTEAVLFTREPYAAATFGNYATPRAHERLAVLLADIDSSRALSSSRHVDVPDGEELWPFQVASVEYALSRPHALIADQPGLGKTPTAISIANEMKADRVLVVCPASIRYQWCRRIQQWSTMGRSYRPTSNGNIYPIIASNRGVDDKASWSVISWDLIRSPGIWATLAKGYYDLLILDEAHYAKTVHAQRTQSIFGGTGRLVAPALAERTKKILALTGTPLPNRPREAFVLARNMCWESIDFLNEHAFNERFNPRNVNRTKEDKIWIDERVGRSSELQNRLRANFMVRHLKREVMPQLKLPVFDLIYVDESKPPIKAALEAERLLNIDPEHLEGADAKILGQIAAARQQMGVAMAPQVAEYVEMLLEGGEDKLVLFAWHVEVLDIIQARLSKYGLVRVDGRDSARAKDRKVQDFIARPDLRVIIGNILSMGTGTDGLQHVSNHGLLAEADWVHGNNEQCFDRLDRGGQREQVQGDIFVVKGSLAEKVLASSLRKASVTEKALDKQFA